ncbi:hypothetical protein OIU84_022956 [Salix udensis]|uniref:Uncharacterized protein n=1 Tax=Salix udensis TaxID=889485 RepID=A0AAD6KS17_9ROSI|nr:hypothetical protein OIU84_022956 [Salix udensis]
MDSRLVTLIPTPLMKQGVTDAIYRNTLERSKERFLVIHLASSSSSSSSSFRDTELKRVVTGCPRLTRNIIQTRPEGHKGFLVFIEDSSDQWIRTSSIKFKSSKKLETSAPQLNSNSERHQELKSMSGQPRININGLQYSKAGISTGSLDQSLDCLLSATNSNTDTSVEDDGISMIFTDCRNLWSFAPNSSAAVSSGESENNSCNPRNKEKHFPSK